MFERRGSGLSISARINLAFGAVVGLLLVLEIGAAFGLKAGSQRFSTFSAISDVAERVIMINRDAASMDRLARRYADSGSEADIRHAQEFSESIGADLAALVANEYASGVKSDLRRMEELLAAYSTAMLKMADARAQRDNLVNWNLHGIAIKARASLTQIMREAAAAGDSAAAVRAGLANDCLQGGRINVYKFLAVPSVQLISAVDSQLDAFIKSSEELASTAQSPAHKAQASEIIAQGREYKAVFAQVAAATGTVGSLVADTLTKYGEEIRSIAGKVAESRRENMNGVREASVAETSRTIAIFGVVAFLALLAGGSIALWTARSVVQPLHGLSEAIMRLSSGDTGITVEGTRRQDEIGLLARAVERFRLSIVEEIEARRTSRRQLASTETPDQLAQPASAEERKDPSLAAAREAAKRYAEALRTGGTPATTAQGTAGKSSAAAPAPAKDAPSGVEKIAAPHR
jgi:methyl-accepting chemotaxis protein